MLSSDAGMDDADSVEEETSGSSREAPPVPVTSSTEDFPLEQSRDDYLLLAFDQFIKINCQMVHPEAGLTFPHFVLIRDRLYRVSCGTRMQQNTERVYRRRCFRLSPKLAS